MQARGIRRGLSKGVQHTEVGAGAWQHTGVGAGGTELLCDHVPQYHYLDWLCIRLSKQRRAGLASLVGWCQVRQAGSQQQGCLHKKTTFENNISHHSTGYSSLDIG